MNVMTQRSKRIGQAQKVWQDQVLNDDELSAICGGGMSSAVSDVLKNFEQALQTAARAA
jgi:hypothetical protein